MPDLDPVAGQADAAKVCATIHPNREEAIAAACRLRSAGWLVPLLPVPVRAASGARVVAIVYDSQTYESPGQVTYTDPGATQELGRVPTTPDQAGRLAAQG